MKLFTPVLILTIVGLISSSAFATKLTPIVEGKPEIRCKVAFDIAALIDVTSSQRKNAPLIRKSISRMIDIVSKYTKHSRVSLSHFTDKPLPPLGYSSHFPETYNESNRDFNDYCLKIETDFNSSFEENQKATKIVGLGGGRDFPESQLDSMLRVLLTPRLKWRQEVLTEDKDVISRIVIIATDAMPHFAGDLKKSRDLFNKENEYQFEDIEANPFLENPELLAKDENIGCVKYEYPTMEDLRKILIKKDILPIFLVGRGVYDCDEEGGLCVYPELIEAASKAGKENYLDIDSGLGDYYRDLLDENQIDALVYNAGDNFDRVKYSDIIDDVVAIKHVCEVVDPTSGPPTTVDPPTDEPKCPCEVEVVVNVKVQGKTCDSTDPTSKCYVQ